jgi:hypothetical protein
MIYLKLLFLLPFISYFQLISAIALKNNNISGDAFATIEINWLPFQKNWQNLIITRVFLGDETILGIFDEKYNRTFLDQPLHHV